VNRRIKRGLAIGGGAALVLGPPPGDEMIGLALISGAGIGVKKMANDTRPASADNPRRKGDTGEQGNSPRLAAYIVIGAVVILAFQAGLFRKIVQ